MLPETIFREIMPAMRSLIAKKMMDNGMSQRQIAVRLGSTQSAISHYKRGLRGYKIDIFNRDPKVLEMVNIITEKLMKGELNPEQITSELFRICEYVISENILE